MATTQDVRRLTKNLKYLSRQYGRMQKRTDRTRTEFLAELRRLYDEGLTTRQLAGELRLSHQRVAVLLQETGAARAEMRREAVLKAHRNGAAVADIATSVGISKQSVKRIIRIAEAA